MCIRDSNYLLYLDCTNLYGTAMRQPLPYSGFRWLEREEIDALNLSTVGAEDDIGYILDVDLGYPCRLHDLNSDYPLDPERRNIGEHKLSAYSKRFNYLKNFHLPATGAVEKLITSLEDKKNYIVHYRTLQLYLKLGMELKAVNRVLAFRQSAWMKPFIDFNTEKRKAAANDFQKDFFKLRCV